MKNINLVVKKRGVETLVITITATTEDGVVTQDIDLGGNATGPALWGARQVVEALQAMDRSSK